MGNNPSGEGGSTGGPRPIGFGGRRGALGLSKAELDKRCQPSGLYPDCKWDDKAIRRLIGDGRLAARKKGHENRRTPSDRECPICFLNYSQINVTKCCQANICTECYLQVRPQKEKSSTCPFCNDKKMTVAVAKNLKADEIEEREAEEQRAMQALLNARARGEEVGSSVAVGVPASPTQGFGSSLERDEMVQRMRARSESMSSDDPPSKDFREEALLRQLSLTQDDRRALETEMRAQLSHPLSRQMESEAEQRRLANVQEYYSNNSGRLRTAGLLSSRFGSSSRRGRLSNDPLMNRDGSRRDWNEIVEAFERGGNGEVQTLDDLVVLEAALILSMEHQQNSETENAGEGGEFDAAQHARDGFPVVQDYLSRRSGSDESSENASGRGFLGSSRRLGRRNQSQRFGGSSSRSMLGGLLTRGITEDEQMALAIAMSLRESENTEQQNTDGDAETQDEQPASDEATREEGAAETETDNQNEETEAAESESPEPEVGTISEEPIVEADATDAATPVALDQEEGGDVTSDDAEGNEDTDTTTRDAEDEIQETVNEQQEEAADQEQSGDNNADQESSLAEPSTNDVQATESGPTPATLDESCDEE